MRISDWSSDVCSSDLGEAQDDRIGDARDLLGLDDLRQHDLEFIAAQPPDLPLVADDLGQPPRRLLEQLVADRMAERVVDRLEAVEVEQQQRARSEEHTTELQSLMRISYAVFCLNKKKHNKQRQQTDTRQT